MRSCQYSKELTFQVSLNLLLPCFLVIYVETIIRLQFTVKGYCRKKKKLNAAECIDTLFRKVLLEKSLSLIKT